MSVMHEPSAATLGMETGRVLGVDAGLFSVATAQGVVASRRATACLLEPMTDDLVLFLKAENGTSYILSILERSEREHVLSVEGDLRLEAKDGALGLRSEASLSLCSKRQVGVIAPELRACAADGTFLIDKAYASGSDCSLRYGSLRMITDLLHNISGRVTQAFDRLIRTVKGEQIVNTGNYRVQSENFIQMHGDNTAMTSNRIMKLDAEQINMG